MGLFHLLTGLVVLTFSSTAAFKLTMPTHIMADYANNQIKSILGHVSNLIPVLLNYAI